MREHETKLILKWIGVCEDGRFTEQMVRDAINYAYSMGHTDGNTDLSWKTNPDRMGGSFSQDEIDNTGWK
jgi:hypothetical protein